MRIRANLRSGLLFVSCLLCVCASNAAYGQTARDSARAPAVVDTVVLKKWAELAAANQQEKADAEWKNILKSVGNASDMDAFMESAIGEYRFACGGIVKPAARFALVKHLDEVTEKVLGSSHLLAASSMSCVADECEKANDLAGALQLRERALAVREDQLGADHEVVLQTKDRLARLLIEMGKNSEAQALIAKTESVYKAHHNAAGLQRITILRSRLNIAAGKRSEKTSDYEKAIDEEAVRKAMMGKDFQNWLAAYNRGDMKAAEALWIRLLQPLKNCQEIMPLLTRARESADWNSPGLVAPDAKLLQILLKLQDWSVKALGPNHSALATSCRQIADYYSYRKMHKESAFWWQKKVDILKHNYGLKDHDTIFSMLYLAKEYEASGNIDAAIKVDKDAIEVCKFNHNILELQRNEQELKRLTFVQRKHSKQ